MSVVREAREALGFSRQGVVDRSRGLLTHANVYSLERGRAPTPDEAAGLSIALGLGNSKLRLSTGDSREESARPPRSAEDIIRGAIVDLPQVAELDPHLPEVGDFSRGDRVELTSTDSKHGYLEPGMTGTVTGQADTTYGRIVDVHWDFNDAPFPVLLHAGDVLSTLPDTDG